MSHAWYKLYQLSTLEESYIGDSYLYHLHDPVPLGPHLETCVLASSSSWNELRSCREHSTTGTADDVTLSPCEPSRSTWPAPCDSANATVSNKVGNVLIDTAAKEII